MDAKLYDLIWKMANFNKPGINKSKNVISLRNKSGFF